MTSWISFLYGGANPELTSHGICLTAERRQEKTKAELKKEKKRGTKGKGKDKAKNIIPKQKELISDD